MYFLVCCNTTTVIFQQWKDGKKLGVAAKNLWKRMCQRTWQDYFGVKKRRYEAFLDVQVVTHKSARSCLVTNRCRWLWKTSGFPKNRQLWIQFHATISSTIQLRRFIHITQSSEMNEKSVPHWSPLMTLMGPPVHSIVFLTLRTSLNVHFLEDTPTIISLFKRCQQSK